MTTLARLQRSFLDALRDRGDAAIALLADGPRNDAATLFDIYRDAYGLRLVEALGQDFPALAALLGPEDFDAIARAYLAAHPSRSFTVRELGRRLPAFLAEAEPGSAMSIATRLADFEWALREVFDEADEAPLEFATVAATAATDWPERRFRPIAALRRLALPAAVPAYWSAVDAADGTSLPTLHEGAPAEWVVWRAGLLREFRSMPADEAWMFDAMTRGVPFAALCEGMCQWHPAEAAASRAAGLLRAWIDHQMLAADP